jgi:hypothetical protein
MSLTSFTIALHPPVAIVKSFSTVKAFYGRGGRQPHSQPPTWKARVSLFVWIITFDLSGTALRFIRPHNPHHYVKVGISTGGSLIFKN